MEKWQINHYLKQHNFLDQQFEIGSASRYGQPETVSNSNLPAKFKMYDSAKN